MMIPVSQPSLDSNLISSSSDASDSWQKQLAQSFKTAASLLEYLGISTDNLPYEVDHKQAFPTRVTRHMADLIDPKNPYDPILRQVLPMAEENVENSLFNEDPLEEAGYNQLPGLIHKYKNRVLLITHQACAIHCRYCFRRHFPYGDNGLHKEQQLKIVQYLKQHKEINEVILSGGDPLVLSDPKLKQLIQQLESVSHLKRLRIHTRTPVVLPDRLTTELLNTLISSRLQATIVFHINHPAEISGPLVKQLQPYRQSGITLLNQSVLLKNINDDPAILAKLSEQLFEAGILPYYLHTTDAVSGAGHFYVELEQAQRIWQVLASELSGYLVPKLVQEIPNKANKTWVNRSEAI